MRVWWSKTITCLGLLTLAGCESLYWGEGLKAGEVITVHVMDTEGIYEKCGSNAQGCAVVSSQGCIVYLPEYPNSEVVVHELSHCAGRIDRPVYE